MVDDLVAKELVHGSSQRLFVNSALTCPSWCSYCYLPSLGFEVGKNDALSISAEELILLVENHYLFITGKYGTILSLGCFSECWGSKTKFVTMKIIKYFLKQGNPIQFATKRCVHSNSLLELTDDILWQGQLTVNISSSTVSRWKDFEQGTTLPEKRFVGFEIIPDLGIPAYLYMKPVISDVTIHDLSIYKELIVSKMISGAIVGSLFSLIDEKDLEVASIGGGALKCTPCEDEYIIKEEMTSICSVFSTSTEVVDYWRNING